MKEERGHFGSKLGVVLASAGSAVGLGNIWRFPTETGSNGGAAFILIYLLFVLLLALPVMISEFVIGRHSRSNTVEAYRKMAPRTPWFVVGIFGVLSGFLVLSFYSVVAGWTVDYTMLSITGSLSGNQDFGEVFGGFVSHPYRPVIFLLLFLLITHVIVAKGIESGIEKFSKLMMPLLLVIIILLVVLSVSMPGAGEGLSFLLHPDFSRVTPRVVFSAMGQAFFSLSVGIGCLVTYSSYFSKETRLLPSALNVCIIDTMVAILAGFIIFPTVFSVGVQPDAGPGLVFVTLPNVFNHAFGDAAWVGDIFSILFYLLLLLAALTSSISMHEISTAYIREHYHVSRSRAAWIVTGVCMFLGTLCSLSFGPWKDVTFFGMGFFDLFDFLTAKFFMPLGGIGLCLFVGWYMDKKTVRDELTNSGAAPTSLYGAFMFLVRFVAPVCIALVFLNELFGNLIFE
ncbi:MAG: sodium-dependent transporter [Bacteroidaceae bacterium]|nr:sodium-dependent transporter [Bacteroidaceae bacterium]